MESPETLVGLALRQLSQFQDRLARPTKSCVLPDRCWLSKALLVLIVGPVCEIDSYTTTTLSLNTMFNLKQRTPIRPPPGLDRTNPRLPNLRYVYGLTASVSIGALLFGYDQGIMGIIVADERWLDLMQPANS